MYIPQNVQLADEEMVPRTETALKTLRMLAEGATTDEQRERLLNKAEGVSMTLEAYRENFQNLKVTADVIALADLIMKDVEEKHRPGVQLVHGYLMEYARM